MNREAYRLQAWNFFEEIPLRIDHGSQREMVQIVFMLLELFINYAII